MTNLPRLFTDKGELIDVDVSSMDADALARLDKLRNAYRANKEAQATLDAAHAEVSAALEAVKNTETHYNAHWPPQTFQDLWRESFAGGPHNIMTARGLK